MTLPIISADERLKETKGIKGCIFGKSGIGKTSLLWTLPAPAQVARSGRSPKIVMAMTRPKRRRV